MTRAQYDAFLDRWLDERTLIGCAAGAVLGILFAHFDPLGAFCGAVFAYLLLFLIAHGPHGRRA